MNLWDGDKFTTVAGYNVPPAFATARLDRSIRPHPKSGLAAVVRTREIAQIHDIRDGVPYQEGDPTVTEIAHLAGARTILMVPVVKDDELIGTITIYRQEVRDFTDKQIALEERP
jgi:GAF domain-containing protein